MARAALFLLVVLAGCVDAGGGSEAVSSVQSIESPASDSAFAAYLVCEDLVREKMATRATRFVRAPEMKRQRATDTFVGRGSVASAAGNAPSEEFVCAIDPGDGRGEVVVRSSDPQRYEALVREFGFTAAPEG